MAKKKKKPSAQQ